MISTGFFCAMRTLFIIPLIFWLQPSFSQWDDCNSLIAPPYSIGEHLDYELVYNWGFIWAKAGTVSFEVRDSIVNGEKLYHFYSYGSSYKGWDWFYKVRSTYQSLVTKDFKPLYFSRIGREGSHRYNNIYNLEGFKAHFSRMDDQGRMIHSSFDLKSCAYDVISGSYYCRRLDFTGLKADDIIPLNLYLDGANFPSQLRYIGKATLEDDRLKRSYDCIVFKPLLIEGTVFSEGENMTVYVTDDARRIPVYIETDLVVGKAKVYWREALKD